MSTEMTNERDSDLDRAAQEAMLSRATMSISVLEKGFIRNGSGRYFVLRTADLDPVMARGVGHALPSKSSE